MLLIEHKKINGDILPNYKSMVLFKHSQKEFGSVQLSIFYFSVMIMNKQIHPVSYML